MTRSQRLHSVSDAESGLIYLRARYYDPSTAQFLSRDPAVAETLSAYGYVDGNPLNGTDPLGLWPWDGACVTFLSDNCVSIKDQHQKGAQQVADFAGGVLNTVSFGNEKRIDDALGNGGKVNRCSGYYQGGEYAGYAVDAIDAAAAGKDLFSKGGLQIVGSRFARAHIDEEVHAFEILGRERLLPHIQVDTWLRKVSGSGSSFRIPLPKWLF